MVGKSGVFYAIEKNQRDGPYSLAASALGFFFLGLLSN